MGRLPMSDSSLVGGARTARSEFPLFTLGTNVNNALRLSVVSVNRHREGQS